MQIGELQGLALPEPVNVYGWRFRGENAAKISKTTWTIAQNESLRLDRADGSSLSVYRLREDDPDEPGYDVWIVDRGRRLEQRSTRVSWLYRPFRVEPERPVAEALVARHLRFLLGADGEQKTLVSHHDEGQHVDWLGRDTEPPAEDRR